MESPLHRVLEPEVMDSAEEALAYDAMDHTDVNRQFVADLLVVVGEMPLTRVLDLGTGTALIPIELCRQHRTVEVIGTDLAESMLVVGRENVHNAGMTSRIQLKLADAKTMADPSSRCPLVMSNSIVHHIPEPMSVLTAAKHLAEQAIFFRDLMRPRFDHEVKQLVATYAGDESKHAQSMFDDSLRAALSLDEIRDLVVELGFAADTVQATSDRHWTWFAKW